MTENNNEDGKQALRAALNLALREVKAERMDEARRLAADALRRHPDDFDALYFHGWLCLRSGGLEEGIEHIERALEVNPGHAEARFNLAAAMRNQGRLEDAAACYRKTVEFDPGNIAAHFNLANVLDDLGEALPAVDAYGKAVDLDPDFALAHFNLGVTLNRLERREEAVQSFERAAAIDPGDAATHYNLGTTLHELGRAEEAVEHLNRAVEIDPDSADAHSNLGSALEDLDRIGEAIACYQRALEIDPSHADAHNNLGAAYLSLDRGDEALDHFERTLDIDPEHPGAHINLSSILLSRGVLGRGWAEYEWRWKRKSSPMRKRNFPQSRWDGSPLQGKSILLWGEQGLGNEICLVSMAADVIAMGAECAIECEPRLVDLFARSFPQARIHARPYAQAESGEAAFDYQIPLGSLSGFLRTSIDDFPDVNGYLVADGERRRLWNDRLSALGDGLRVGVSWRSSLMTHSRRAYFASIAELQPLLTLKDIVFVNLQYDDCAKEIAEAKDRFGVTLHAWDDIDLMNDIDGAAALTSCLDVVVTPITSVYETAGALGIPTFAFHPPYPLMVSLGTDGVPYYPSVRIFKRRADEGWERVYAETAAAIEELKAEQ